MYKQKSALFLLCETPLHAGSGDDLGLVDLPIQRERHTAFPKIESSSIKGALREAFENMPNKLADTEFQVNIHRIFGYDSSFEKGITKDDDLNKLQGKEREEAVKKNERLVPIKKALEGNTEYSGCLAFTDARLLLFPVKSMKGVFVWLTCKQVLNKFASDMAIAGVEVDYLDAIKAIEVDAGKALASSDTALIRHNDKDGKSVVLEEYAFDATVNDSLRDFASKLADIVFADDKLAYWRQLLPQNLIVLSDMDFRDFTQMSTEVVTRIKIDNETGTVEDGALFTEEYLPNDSVMYSLVMASDEHGKNRKTESAEWAMDFFDRNMKEIALFQLGGNATLGKGILRTQLTLALNGKTLLQPLAKAFSEPNS